MSNLRDTYGELRGVVDGTGGFMNGHQIINSDRARGFKRAGAAWAHDDKSVRDLLIRVFPKLETDKRQRARAGRWMRIIQLYHRFGHSYGDVAAEMGISVTAIKTILQRMRHDIKGVPRNVSRRKPRSATSGTSLGDQ